MKDLVTKQGGRGTEGLVTTRSLEKKIEKKINIKPKTVKQQLQALVKTRTKKK